LSPQGIKIFDHRVRLFHRENYHIIFCRLLFPTFFSHMKS